MIRTGKELGVLRAKARKPPIVRYAAPNNKYVVVEVNLN